jgi:hypothetical protein
MKIDLTQVEFDQSELNTLREILFYAIDKEDLTDEQVLGYWDKLPIDIKLEALNYGVSDTPTREKMWSWFENNL